ncbi:MAG TPA: methyltransferase domain-containing protein [Isosphaeraceae bacterium]|nr:methyltransferase domain-containing protein [Isosphaeraceae bacterium]
MKGWLARWYARTRRNDVEDFRRQAGTVAEHLSRGCNVLEVAPGPGFFAIELAKLGDFKITGLDISRTFVEIAMENARNAGVKIDFRLGNASAMPFAGESFDFIYCSAAFKNFSEPVKALDEMHRVLRPGGEAMVVDLRKDVSLDEIDAYVKQSGRSRIDAWMTSWAFRCMLIKRAYTKDEFSRMAEQSRFGTCQIHVDSISLDTRFMKSAQLAVGVS